MLNTTPIAVVGMGGVFPGAFNLEKYWEVIQAGRDLSSEASADRWGISPARVHQPWPPAPDRVYCRRGYFIDRDFKPNISGLAIEPEELSRLDPSLGLLLDAGRQAWAACKTENLDPARAGVILGQIALPTDATTALTLKVLGKRIAEIRPELSLGKGESLFSSRAHRALGLPAVILASVLGLGGGGWTLDAACASSLFAVILACEKLLSGQVDLMLAGGMSRPDCLYTQMGFSQLRALSSSGFCAPFDARGDGLMVGEGAGVVVLKRLEDALADRDMIWGLIRGWGVSNDLEGGLLAPAAEGQLRAMKSAYRMAGWSPWDLDFVECHATGTPLGDRVEIESLKMLWSDSPRRSEKCVLSSVKSTVGHLLTGAGAAGLIKALLALNKGVLPPTTNFIKAPPDMGLDDSPFEVTAEARPWVKTDRPKRSAISGFGFGGANAHLLLEEWDGQENGRPVSVRQKSERARPVAAVVGLAASVGPWHNLKALARRWFFEEEKYEPAKRRTWWGLDGGLPAGWYIDEVKIPIGRFRIPPTELADMLPQQALMLLTAAEALNDAGYEPSPDKTAGVVVGLSLDQNTANFHLRWSLEEKALAVLKRQGLSTGDSESEYPGKVKDAVGPPLSADRVLGNLASITASRIAREFKMAGPSLTVSSEGAMGLVPLDVAVRALQTGQLDLALAGAVDFPGDVRGLSIEGGDHDDVAPAEGAAALVLKRLEDAEQDRDHIYAAVYAVDDKSPDLYGLDYLESFGTDAHVNNQQATPPLIGAAETDVGRAGAASGMISMVRTALALKLRQLPSCSIPGASETGEGSIRRIRPGYWLKNRIDGPRQALVQGPDSTSVRLDEYKDESQSVIDLKPARHEALFVVRGADKGGLLRALAELGRSAASTRSIEDLEKAWREANQNYPDSGPSLALIADDPGLLTVLIEEARSKIQAEVGRLAEDRIFFESEPLGLSGETAFVFPGSGNHFPGMGHDLGAARPDIFHRQNAVNDLLKDQFAAGRFWYDPNREIDHRDLISAQVAAGSVVYDVLTGHGLKPQALLGHSLGETAALFASGAWKDRDGMQKRMAASTLFTRDLAGECRAARNYWDLNPEDPINWLSVVVACPADRIRALAADFPKVFLQTVNAPDECMIGGEEASVKAMLERLGCFWVPAPGVSTVHCPVVQPLREDYRQLHLFPTKAPDGVRLYSAAWGRSYQPDRDMAADSITDQALTTMDFPRLIESAYNDGVRLFLELGPGGSCTRMISRILDGRRFAARAVYISGRDVRLSVWQALAWAAAHRVKFTLHQETETPGGRIETRPEKKIKEITTPTGKTGLVLPAPPSIMEKKPRPAPVQLPLVDRIPASVPVQPRSYQNHVEEARALESLIRDLDRTQKAQARAHKTFLNLSAMVNQAVAENLDYQFKLTALLASGDVDQAEPEARPPQPIRTRIFMDREQCLEFAVGSIGRVLGPRFEPVDSFPTRVRLPDEPLMLVDRIMEVEGEPLSMKPGRVVTEHDVLKDGWYLDNGRIPACIAIEAGQADLFLSGYLGVDFETRGLALYRLLDAEVTFMGPLPGPGEIISYDIRIERFFRHGRTHLFRFNFEVSVDGRPLMVMRNGCAGFFTQAELDAGQGLTAADMNKKPEPGKLPVDWIDLVERKRMRLNEDQVQALYHGDPAACFGPGFEGLEINAPLTLPSGRLELIDRVLDIDPNGGRYGLGSIKTEMDIHPDDWFLTCHFTDDMVMPGTLMYECCLHSLRIYLLSLGWIGEEDETVCEPLQDVTSKLKCRGQVIPTTQKASFEIFIKELGYDPAPYAVADGIMYSDDRPVVGVEDMTVSLTGLTREKLAALWAGRQKTEAGPEQEYFSSEQILAFAQGRPSDAFGEPYRIFDQGRFVARLPAPPYSFIDRILRVQGAEPFEIRAGAEAEAEYNPPEDAWYFRDNNGSMPFSVLLETVLQPCGWMSAYSGAALLSQNDLHFRNLGGTAVQKAPVHPGDGPLNTRIKLTRASRSGDMFIQHYDFSTDQAGRNIYDGSTYFGFFTKESLANQLGLQDNPGSFFQTGETECRQSSPYPDGHGYARGMIRMIDEITLLSPAGGPAGLGAIQGRKIVNPDDWFFEAHFYQDPVWPGSLGLEALIQLMQVQAAERWNPALGARFEACAAEAPHEWIYRGQVVPTNREVLVEAAVVNFDDSNKVLTADGFLSVDGLTIYSMKGFSIKLVEE